MDDENRQAEAAPLWLNMLLNQFWPYATNFGSGLIDDLTEPYEVLDYQWGDTAPHFTRIRTIAWLTAPRQSVNSSVVDDGSARITVEADVEYDGDARFEFRYGIIGGGVELKRFSGRIRLLLEPCTAPPFVRNVKVFALAPPLIEYKFRNILRVGNMDVLKKRINRAILKVLRRNFVYPKMFDANLDERASSQSESATNSTSKQCRRAPEAESDEAPLGLVRARMTLISASLIGKAYAGIPSGHKSFNTIINKYLLVYSLYLVSSKQYSKTAVDRSARRRFPNNSQHITITSSSYPLAVVS